MLDFNVFPGPMMSLYCIRFMFWHCAFTEKSSLVENREDFFVLEQDKFLIALFVTHATIIWQKHTIVKPDRASLKFSLVVPSRTHRDDSSFVKLVLQSGIRNHNSSHRLLRYGGFLHEHAVVTWTNAPDETAHFFGGEFDTE